jgi:hypothetical protein
LENKKKYIILGVAIIVVIGVLFLVNSFSKRSAPIESKQDKPSQELEQFEKIPQRKVNPTGTHLIYKLLEKYKNTASIRRIQTSYYSPLSEKLPLIQKNETPNIYLSVAESFNLEKEDNDYLFEFVEKGNHAFISFESLHKDFVNHLLPNSETPFYIETDTAVGINFFHPFYKREEQLIIKNPSLNYHHLPKYKSWLIINEEALTEEAVEIAYLEDLNTICVLLKYGKGSFIFHSLPDAFSNAFVAKIEGKKHAEIIFSHFPKGNYYWHENFGKYSTYRGESNPDQLQKPKEFSRSSPLQYILKVPSLTIALVLSMIGLLLYMLVKSKRKQRVIPPIESDKNSSLEFIEVIAKLYQKQNRHDKILKHIYQNFISFIKQRYYIEFSNVGDEVIDKIHLKSGVEKVLIERVFSDLNKSKGKQITDKELITIYQNIDLFHKSCK